MIADLRTAFAFLTILPVGYSEGTQPGRSFAYYPFVGLIIGLLLSLIASTTFFPTEITAFLTLAAWVIITGGLHLDGFADSCDGLLATTQPARRLEIMKDPQAGSWAVIGLALLLLGKWVALRHLSPLAVILPPIVGRWSMTAAVQYFAYARSSGTGAYFRQGFGRVQFLAATLTTLVMLIILSALTRWTVLLVLPVAALTVALVGRWAANKLGGGLTGDVYGALCELIELLSLFVLVANG